MIVVGQIITEVEDVYTTLMEIGADENKLNRHITREKDGLDEYFTTIKQVVSTEAIKWVLEKDFLIRIYMPDH